ncbi:MAG TPA: hypothetical protein VH986_09700 [Acidimicrobiia bacterium]|jgi:hypothetical protein
MVRRSAPVVLVALLAAVSIGAAAARPPGAARPIAATGLATAAAMKDPRCNTGPGFNVYGNWNTTTVGGNGQGPICVKPWSDGADNGGATSPGVTRDKIVVVAIIPSDDQTQALLKDPTQAPGVPVDRATGTTGTWEDAVHDHLLPLLEFYETWGRAIEVRFVRSSGTDETAQRADAVAVKALKPFAAVDLLSQGLLTLDGELAKAKIVTFGTVTTATQALAQQPYRWGATDGQATAVNAAAVVGRQLAGKKAAFAGDALMRHERVFGAVAADTVDLTRFTSDLKKQGATLKVAQAYNDPGGIVGDPVMSQEAAPTIVSKMKAAGVTTILLFADSSMVRSMMEAATKLDYFPEWFNSGVLYSELTLWARTYPVEQSKHMFGMSWLTPWLAPDSEQERLADPENWYWGANQGTAAAVSVAPLLNWLVAGIHLAGPHLTPKTFQQGYFSAPAAGGAASGNPLTPLIAYGRQTGLPYPSYMYGGTDFVPFWYDPDTTGIASVTGVSAKGVAWYPNQGMRYKADTVTEKSLGYFEKSNSIVSFETRPTAAPTPVYAGDCTTCPAATGATKPGSPTDDGFVAKAHGAGSTGI